MASILNNASFLFNPAGSIISYEEDKVFSVLPNDGTVDGAVGGNSGGGTRVNQQGYIETVPANLMTYSEVVSNWTGNLFGNWIDCSVTSNSAIAPNGTLTADRIGDGFGRFNASAPATPNQTYTYSVYLKNVSLTSGFYIWFAFGLNGSLVSYGQALFIPITSLSTTEWTKFTATVTAPSSGINEVQFGPCPFTAYNYGPTYSSPTYNASGAQLDVWGGMINIGTSARPYQPTTDRLGYPRIDYKSGKGKLLQEPQRTNLALQSNVFASVGIPSNYNGYYYYNLATLNNTNNLSPDGTKNAYNITMHDSSYDMYSTFNVTSGVTYTYSLYVKLGSATNFAIVVNNTQNWNTVAGSQTFTNLSGTDYTRVSITFVAPSTGVVNMHLGGHSENITQQSPGTVYIWGQQLEEGSYPTSYIPTNTSTVTRAITNVTFSSPGPTKAFATKPGIILYDFDFYNFADSTSYETFLYNGGTTGGDYFYFAKLAGTGNIYWDGDNVGGYFYAGSFTPKQGKNRSAWYFTETNSYWYVNGSLLYTGNYFDTTYFNSMQTYAVPGNNFAVNTFASIPNTSSISQAQVQAWTNFNSGSGGTISYSGPYTIHTFTGSGTFTPSFTGQVEVLVVAGGGGTGYDVGGGGGGGGILYASSYGVSAGTGITVTIGAGGTSGQTPSVAGGNGGNSVFGGLTALGGGGGGTYPSGQVNGLDGGSGGGAGNQSAVGGSGSIGQGYNGGSSSAPWGSGGGGGAAGNGENAIQNQTVQGGLGATYSISGFNTVYSGGGFGAYDGQTLRPTGQDSSGTTLGYYGFGANGTGFPNSSPYIGNQGIVIVRYLT